MAIAIVVLAALFVMLGAQVLGDKLPVSQGAVRVDMTVSDGQWVELFINNVRDTPQRQRLLPGARHLYEFRGLNNDLTFLRLDPGEAPGTEIILHSIQVVDESGVVREFSPQQLMTQWGTHNISGREIRDGALHMVAVNNDPILETWEKVTLRRNAPAFVGTLNEGFRTPRFTLQILLFGFVAMFAVSALDGRRRGHVAVGVLAVAAVLIIINTVTQSYQPLSAVHTAVGRGSFLGLSLDAQRIAALLALLASFAIGAGGGLYLRYRTNRSNTPADTGTDDHHWRKRDTLFMGAVAAIMAATLFPDVRGLLNTTIGTQFTPDWDGNNIFTWEYLIHSGNIPLKDFWYPYAGHAMFQSDAPWGFLLRVLHRVVIFTLFLWGFHAIAGQRMLLTLFVAILLVVADGANLVWASWRYITPLAIAATYIAIDRRKPIIQAGHWAFWTSLLWTLITEPLQIVSAAPAVAAVLLLDVIDTRPSPKRLAAQLTREFAVPAGSLLVMLIWWAAQGQLAGYIDFHLKVSDQGIVMAMPSDLWADLSHPLSIRFALVMTPFVSLAIGLAERLRGDQETQRRSNFLLALGLAGFMVLQKHIVRSMDWQMFVFVALAILAYSILWLNRRRPLVELVVLGLIAGGFTSVILRSNIATPYCNQLMDAQRRVGEGAAITLGQDRELVNRANAIHYTPEQFKAFKSEQLVRTWFKERFGEVFPLVYVLGDSPITYAVLQQTNTPYHVHDLSAAPIYEQRKNVAWLEKNKPSFVLWNPDTLVFEMMKNYIRVPLIYTAVASEYVPEASVGRFKILRRRAPDEPPAMAFWQDHLGSRADVGHIARISSLSRFAPCAAEPCREFLHITLASPQKGKVAIPLHIGERGFEIAFDAVSSQSEYFVSASRIWFWALGRRFGQPIEVDTPPGATVAVERRAERDDILY
ncbi:hypothetical protein [Magnetospirillum sp. 15-1]|uniref:hypothetical protein n=1 Tax=Magnetospirillum sp. 15-1 TaxID=1979370 RepID=UPI001142D906|nr:hypothetical protein [Magnetospirillum sp. 15-1]